MSDTYDYDPSDEIPDLVSGTLPQRRSALLRYLIDVEGYTIEAALQQLEELSLIHI